ncbi:MAG: hypothetical protein RMY16_16670 [Nostoc sp. DedQUE12b]|uniref:hypothetical protein n=1 Tax=Nostoc sp. DedQUE12b TaxID=3075398 RepID=UPI002AD3851A|nr:hypothetical protein [Nostoc sp. DedQUE12b]MDZ8087170.1 hypothetical protein [Nostoc sp. DedQUE12b]
MKVLKNKALTTDINLDATPEMEELTDSEASLVVGGAIISYSSYNRSTIDYDISLLITSSDIPINGGTVRAVNLAISS